MSCINDVTTSALTSNLTSQTVSSGNSSESTSEGEFENVMLKALQNCNGKRPAHVCCCCESESVETEDVEEANETENIEANVKADDDSTTESEKSTAASCFTMFIRVSARITGVSSALCDKFVDTTVAFADALKADKSYNENLLNTYLQKTDEKLSSTTAELKNYIDSYLDNMLTAVKSSLSGLNSTLLSSSNLLGSSSLSSVSNLLGNSSLLSSSGLLGSGSNSLATTLWSSLSGTSSSSSGCNPSPSSLAGYAASDVANVKIAAALNGTSNYTYGIGTSLNTNRYNGRNLELIRTSEVTATGIKMVDKKGNVTTGVVPTGIEIGDSSARKVAKVVASNPVVVDTDNTVSAVADSENANADADENTGVAIEDSGLVQVKVADYTSPEIFVNAVNRKNHILDMFKQMIFDSLNKSDDSDKDNGIKQIDARISVKLV